MPDDSLPLLPLVVHRVPLGLRQALAQEGIACVDHQAGQRLGRFVIWDSRSHELPDTLPGQTLIDVEAIREVESDDPFELLVDEQSERHAWRIGGLTVSEEIACADKLAVRRRMLQRLRDMVESHAGVWLRLSAFPFPYRSAFNFRIDYDDFNSRDFDRLQCVLRGREHATSHYVCGSTHIHATDALARLRGRDVGSHGYWHHTYADADENLRNIRRGIEFLQQAGIEPAGFVAPHGRFNRGLLEALEQLGVGHSSEFGLAYDELPFFPNDRSVLQIPVHPVCLGLFVDLLKRQPTLDASSVVRIATDYFVEVAIAKYRAGEPVFLYCHPTRCLGRYPQLLGELFDCIGGFAAVWETTLTQFAAWWRARGRVALTLSREGGEYRVLAIDLSPGWRVGVELCRGEHVALMPIESGETRFSPESLAWQSRPASELPQPVRVDGAHSLKGVLLRYLDWERVTPVEEISVGSFRGWAKQTLRRVRG